MNKTRNATATNGGSATGSSSVVSGVGPSTNGPTTKDFGLANIGLDTIRANGAVQFAQLRNPLTKGKINLSFLCYFLSINRSISKKN